MNPTQKITVAQGAAIAVAAAPVAVFSLGVLGIGSGVIATLGFTGIAASLASTAYLVRPTLQQNRVTILGQAIPGTGPASPETPAQELLGRVQLLMRTFQARHPQSGRWIAPPEPQLALPSPHPLLERSLIDQLSDLPSANDHALGPNPPEQDVDYKRLAQEELQKLVKRSAYFVVLQLSFPPLEKQAIMELVAEASQPGQQESLWNLAIARFGNQLSFLQKARASLFYTLIHSSGLIENSLQFFLETVTREFRDRLTGPNRAAHLGPLFQKILAHTEQFLRIHRIALETFADAKRTGGKNAQDYRKEAMESDLEQNPLSERCIPFSHTLVDAFFPHIPFFKKLKASRWFGWLYQPIETSIGTPMNWAGKKVVLYFAPKVTFNLMQTGLKAADPTNRRLATIMADTLTQLFLDLSQQVQKETEQKEIKALPATTIPGTEKLPGVISQLIDLVELLTSENQESMGKVLDALKKPGPISRTIRSGATQATYAVFHRLLNDVKITEKLWAQAMQTLSNSLNAQPGPDTSEEQYNNAKRALQTAAANLFEKIVDLESRRFVEGPKNVKPMTELAHREHTEKALAPFETLQAIVATITAERAQERPGTILPHLDHLAQELARFTAIMQELLYIKPVQESIDRTYGPIYAMVEKLAEWLLHIQKLQFQHDGERTIKHTFAEIRIKMDRLNLEITTDLNQAKTTIEQLREEIRSLKPHLPKQSLIPTICEKSIQSIEDSLTPIEKEEAILTLIRSITTELNHWKERAPNVRFDKKSWNKKITALLAQLSTHEANLTEHLTTQIRTIQQLDQLTGRDALRVPLQSQAASREIDQTLRTLTERRNALKQAAIEHSLPLRTRFRAFAVERQNHFHQERKKLFEEISQAISGSDPKAALDQLHVHYYYKLAGYADQLEKCIRGEWDFELIAQLINKIDQLSQRLPLHYSQQIEQINANYQATSRLFSAVNDPAQEHDRERVQQELALEAPQLRSSILELCALIKQNPTVANAQPIQSPPHTLNGQIEAIAQAIQDARPTPQIDFLQDPWYGTKAAELLGVKQQIVDVFTTVYHQILMGSPGLPQFVARAAMDEITASYRR